MLLLLLPNPGLRPPIWADDRWFEGPDANLHWFGTAAA
jgi:hypothetical protein